MSEATDPMNAPGVKVGRGGHHYQARVLAKDHAADALRRAQVEFYKDEQAAEGRDADIWVVEKVPDRLHRPDPNEQRGA